MSPKKRHQSSAKARVIVPISGREDRYKVQTDQPDIENGSPDTDHESKSDAGEDDPGLAQSMADTGKGDPGPVDAVVLSKVARERLNDLRLTINSSPGVFLLGHMRLSSNTVLSIILKLVGFVIIIDSVGRKNFQLGSTVASATTENIMD